MRTILLIFLLAATASAQYLPSGPRADYNATVDSSMKATGGPLWNYEDANGWHRINPNFRLESGWLVADSGEHEAHADLATNTIWLEWNGHWMGLKVGPLYALRYSTKDTVRLAAPVFTNRSYSGNEITFTDIYPGVDVTITNTVSSLEHHFSFGADALASIETWWLNNGSLDDIYIVNSIRWIVDSLNCPMTDNLGALVLDEPRDITGKVEFMSEGTPLFAMQKSAVTNTGYIDNYDDYRKATLYNRVILLNDNVFHLEGFKYSDIRGWPGAGVSHSELFGNNNTTGDFNSGLVADDKISFNHTMNAETGTATKLHFRATNGGAGSGTVTGFIYSHNVSDDPDALLATSTSTATVNVQAYTEYNVDISYSLEASTEYWIGIQNQGANTMRIQDNGSDDLDSKQNTDALPLEDPHSAGLEQSINAYIWIVYTVSGGATSGRIIMIQ